MNDCDFTPESALETADLLAALESAVGIDSITTDSDAMTPFVRDWTGRFAGSAVAVVRPETTEQVSAVIKACAAHNAAVLTQGGNTGLVGGSVPAPLPTAGPGLFPNSGEVYVEPLDENLPTISFSRKLDVSRPSSQATVVLSTTRLVGEQPVDQAARTLQVGAGVTVARVQQLAAASGLFYGVDLASRDSATIGGTVATNAGGIRVCAYGMTRTKIRGLEAVLADGAIVSSMRGLPKDNTGYDLNGLLCGSEGTLAVITQVLLQLEAPPTKSAVALLGVDSLGEAVNLYNQASKESRVLAAEAMDRAGTKKVCELAELSWPLAQDESRYLMLMEWELEEDANEVASWIPTDADAIVGFSATDKERLWAYRERQSEAAQTLPDRTADEELIKLDVSLPMAGLGDFDLALRDLIAHVSSPEKLIVFGHVGDGNLHLEIAAPTQDADDITLKVLQEVGARGGSISGEHGIGRAKAKYLHLSRSPQELATMQALKDAMDPHNLLAPGVILP